MVEGTPIPLNCRDNCEHFKRYGNRRCRDAVFVGLSPCTETFVEICRIVSDEGKFQIRTAGADIYRRSANSPHSDKWCDWFRVGSLNDEGFLVPVVK